MCFCFSGLLIKMKVFVSTLFLVVLSSTAQGQDAILETNEVRDSKCK